MSLLFYIYACNDASDLSTHLTILLVQILLGILALASVISHHSEPL